MLAALCLPVQNEMVPVGGTAFVTDVLQCQHPIFLHYITWE